MPYVRIKAYPKDEETKRRLAQKISEAFLEVWGCPCEAISVSIEEVSPAEWDGKIVKGEIEPNSDKMFILFGQEK